MSRFTIEEKISAVKRYLEGGMSCCRIAETMGIDESTFRSWCIKYESMGMEAFRKTKNNKYTLQFKLTAAIRTSTQLIVGNCAAFHVKAAIDYADTAAIVGLIAADLSVNHGELAVENMHAAAHGSRAAGDLTAVHGERAAFHKYIPASAVNAIVLALIPADGPTVQDKTAAGFDDDSAAGISIVSTGDNTAGHGILYGQTALDGDNVAPFPGIASPPLRVLPSRSRVIVLPAGTVRASYLDSPVKSWVNVMISPFDDPLIFTWRSAQLPISSSAA